MSEADTDRADRPDPPPSLDQSLRNVGKAGKDGFTSAVDTARAMRSLVLADFALARVAMARAMVWISVAAVSFKTAEERTGRWPRSLAYPAGCC